MENLITKTCTKLYQNRPRFVKDMTKTFWCVFRFTVLTIVHLQNANAKFHKIGGDTIQARQKMFTFLYDKFTQDNMYQILSQSVRFCRLYIKKHFGVFFRFTVYIFYLFKIDVVHEVHMMSLKMKNNIVNNGNTHTTKFKK